MKAIEELAPQVGTAKACRSLGVCRATVYRHRQPQPPAPATTPRPKPPRALSDQERRQVLDVLHSEPFADKAPAEVYAALLDRGQYLCSIRTMYRILEDHQEVRERRNQLRHPNYPKPQLVATAPNQVWSWDITKLLGPAKWTYFYLYVILDIFSRYVVGWMLASRESEHLAERLIRETVVKERVVRDQLTIHSDRGPSMRSQTVAQLLATLGITKSHSRPHVSDDNPFSESQFKTLKYRPEFPHRFASIEHGLDFCGRFFHWQNHEHHHWGLGLLTPAVVHAGQAAAALAARQAVLDAALAAHPERFVRHPPRPLTLPAEVWINPPADQPEPRMLQLPHDTNFVPQLSQTG
jgi:putative transposase